jgi:hypothetical protein
MSQEKTDITKQGTQAVSKTLRNKLAASHACYVLITCNHPDDKGSMQVEMTYEGDASLAAMLIENAQSYLQDDVITADAH